MLPPPPPPPMARPVAIIRSTGELTMASANSPPTSSTPPMTNNSSPEGHCHESALSPSPPNLSSDMSSVRVSSVVTSPFAVSREYTFSHIHTQPGQVINFVLQTCWHNPMGILPECYLLPADGRSNSPLCGQ